MDQYPSRMSRSNRGNKKNKQQKNFNKKSHKKRNIILGIIGALLVAFGVFAAVGYFNAKNAINQSYDASGVKKSRNVNQLLNDNKPFSILLLGTDDGELGRGDSGGRSDSMMYVVVNPAKKTTTMISLQRDTMISIPGQENNPTAAFPQKLNAAYAFGGVAGSISTVQDLLNVPIDFYALVNMGGLEKVIDQLGGITVESPLTFDYNPDIENGVSMYKFYEGKSGYDYAEDGVNFKHYEKMDGKAALAFSRMRYDDPRGDYGRQARQRSVIAAVIKAAKSQPQKILDTGFMNSISSNVKTDLTFDDITKIVTDYNVASKKINSDHMQGYGQEYAGVSYQRVTTEERQRLTNMILKALGTDKGIDGTKNTGSEFAGPVTQMEINSVGSADVLFPSAASSTAITADEESYVAATSGQ